MPQGMTQIVSTVKKTRSVYSTARLMRTSAVYEG